MICKEFYSQVSTRTLKFVFVLMLAAFSLPAMSQIQNNILFYNKGRVTDTHENRLDYGQLKYFMQDDDKAMEHLHLSRAYFLVGTGASIVGLSALYMAEAIDTYEGPVFWTLFGGGCVLGLGGVLVGTVASRGSLKKAVSIYNSKFQSSSTSFEYDIKFGLTSSGIGLTMQF